MEKKTISTESYKGVRDFFPHDMAIQNYIFSVWKKTLEKFGYEEYNASVLEPAELYRAKTGDEIVNEQTYSFTDRGGREVTLRPEMTPTLARMVAQRRRDLPSPVRWYSIPNVFRYEKPQRGRLREHWQLNVDVFGIENVQAEIEIVSIVFEIMKAFGMKEKDFEVRINNRKIMNYLMKDFLKISDENAHKLSKLIDRKEKMSKEEFEAGVKEFTGEKSKIFLEIINSKNFREFLSHLPNNGEAVKGVSEVNELIENLEGLGIENAVFDQTLMRGFDYYTGTVFEVFDKNPDNRRSVFGGGRYDDLLSIFGEEKVPAIGFGCGDVIVRDLLETYKLLPKFDKPIDLYICIFSPDLYKDAQELAQELRDSDIKVAIDYSGKKIGDQIKSADKHGSKFVICIGENEIKSGEYKIKDLQSGREKTVKKDELVKLINKE